MEVISNNKINHTISPTTQIIKNIPLTTKVMLKGQVVAGDFSKIVMRIKSQEEVELGELLVIDHNNEKTLLQVYDLLYGSQISQQNLEMVAGFNLEEGHSQLLEAQPRNYQLA